MDRHRLRLIVLLIIYALLSCSKDDGVNSDISLLQISPAMSVVTKSLTDNSNIAEKTIGIHVTNAAGSAPYGDLSEMLNLRLLRPEIGGAWVIDNGSGSIKEVRLTEKSAHIFAYSPYFPLMVTGTGETAKMTVDIPQEQTADYVHDYLWGSQGGNLPQGGGPINASNANVNLGLNHALSIVAFVIYRGGYDGAGDITSLELKHKNGLPFRVNSDGENSLSMKLADGSLVGGKMVSHISAKELTSKILEANPGEDPLILLNSSNIKIFAAPFSASEKGDLEFSVNIDGNTFVAKYPGSGPLEVAAGNVKIITARLSPKSLNITGVAEWSLVEYEVSSGYSDDWSGIAPVQIGNLLWAPVNVGYDPVSNPYGLMFQWHRKYGQLYGTANIFNGMVDLLTGNDVVNNFKFYKNEILPNDWCNVRQPIWDMSDQYNPCPSGWRVPNVADFNNLLSYGSTWVNSAEGGMDNLPGRWYGGNHSTNRDGSVFFPAAGLIGSQGLSSYRFSGPQGNYYSVEVSGNDAYRLRLTSTISGVFTINRAAGLSVRCVKSL